MIDKQNTPDLPAWVQLYMARRRPPPQARTRPRGRPRRLVPRDKKTAFRLTEGEHTDLKEWQTRLSDLIGRRVSFGETVGILSRICTARWESLQTNNRPASLADLVERMVGD
jgi:hypothetical protein